MYLSKEIDTERSPHHFFLKMYAIFCFWKDMCTPHVNLHTGVKPFHSEIISILSTGEYNKYCVIIRNIQFSTNIAMIV